MSKNDIKNAVKELIDIDSGAHSAKELALAGYSNAQEQFATRAAELAIQLGEEFANVVEGIKAEKKSLASKTKLWGDPAVAPRVKTFFTKGKEVADGGSTYNAAYSLASRVKKGDAKNASEAALLYKQDKAKSEAEAATPEGAVKKAKSALKRALKKVGFTDGDLEPVVAALNTLAANGPSVEPEPEASTPAEDVQVSAAVSKAAAPTGGDDLETLLSSIMSSGVSDEAKSAAIVGLLNR